MYFLALEISQAWSQWIWPILQFVIGLGVMIFAHELGHFITAKLVNIKVERFSIGFGPRLFGFKKGETDYRISAIPLGGYVKMLGQEDVGSQEHASDDPRSFMNKSVGARFIVVAAGVVMNVILAAVLFIIVCLVGINFEAPIVGDVLEGKPASRARISWQGAPPPQAAGADEKGLKAGDRVLRINSREVNTFQDFLQISVWDREKKVHEMVFRRTVDGREYTGTARVKIRKDDQKSKHGGVLYGILPPWRPIFDKTGDYLPSGPFRPGDRVVSIDGKKIEHGWDILEIQKTLDGSPVTVAVEREVGKGKTERQTYKIRPSINGGKHKDQLLDVLGMVPRVRIGSILKDAPADEAGLKPGDIILAFADRPRPTHPEMLELNEQFAGKKTNITVGRDGESLTMQIQPSSRQERIGVTVSPDVADMVVAGIAAESVADKAGIMSGDVIEKINDRPVASWAQMINVLKGLQGQDVTVTYRRGQASQQAELGRLSQKIFDAEDYKYSLFNSTLPFKGMEVTIRKTNPLAAVAWGTEKVVNFIALQYTALQMLITGEVGTGGMAGPVGIGSMAVSVSRQSAVRFVYFMGMISVVLAVINFLPFPVLDGGLAVLLIIEKIIGRPVPARVVTIVWTIGLILLLGFFVWIMWHDISRLIENMW